MAGYKQGLSGTQMGHIESLTEVDHEDEAVAYVLNNNCGNELDVPAVAVGRGRPKRKDVIRLVATRTLSDRRSRMPSSSVLENEFGAMDQPRTVINKDSRAGVQILEPVEMMSSDDCVSSEVVTGPDVAAAEVEIQPDEENVSFEEQFLAHQAGDTLWPLVSQEAFDFATTADIILGITNVRAEQICESVPQVFTNTGVFVVDLSSFPNRHEITMDGLGWWGKPQGSSRFYKYVNGMPQRTPNEDSADVKILCSRYEHPGTNQRGRYVRKIYTGTNISGEPLPLAVIVYEWSGEPHPIQVHSFASAEASRRPYGSRSWEVHNFDASRDAGLEFDGQPLYAKAAIDFDTVTRIILGSIPVSENRLCIRVPQGYRSPGTFIIDLSKFGTDLGLRRDGNGFWGKPSGCSRYFKISSDGEAVRVDKSQHPSQNIDYDIQVLSKRYENLSIPGKRFVRKIYTGKVFGGGAQQICSLAVITYFWKGAPVPIIVDDYLQHSSRFCGREYDRTDNERQYGPHKILEGSCGDQDEEPEGSRLTSAQLNNGEDQGSCSQNRPDVEGRVPNITPRSSKSRTYYPLRAHPYWDSEPRTFEGLILSHPDHLKRLALAKEIENQNRFSALLDRAENMMNRVEQASNVTLPVNGEAQYVLDDGDGIWEAQTVDNVADTVTVQESAAGGSEEVPGAAQLLGNEADRITIVPAGDFMSIPYQC